MKVLWTSSGCDQSPEKAPKPAPLKGAAPHSRREIAHLASPRPPKQTMLPGWNSEPFDLRIRDLGGAEITHFNTMSHWMRERRETCGLTSAPYMTRGIWSCWCPELLASKDRHCDRFLDKLSIGPGPAKAPWSSTFSFYKWGN